MIKLKTTLAANNQITEPHHSKKMTNFYIKPTSEELITLVNCSPNKGTNTLHWDLTYKTWEAEVTLNLVRPMAISLGTNFGHYFLCNDFCYRVQIFISNTFTCYK